MTTSATKSAVTDAHEGPAANDQRLELDDVVNVEQVAVLLKLGRNAVYDAVARDQIPHRRIGKHIRFSRRGLMRWLASWSLQDAKEGK